MERGGQWGRAMEAYDEMRDQGIVPDSFTVVALVTACERSGRLEVRAFADAAPNACPCAHASGIPGERSGSCTRRSSTPNTDAEKCP